MASTPDDTDPGTPPVIASAVRLFVIAALVCVAAAVVWIVLRKMQVVPRGGASRYVPMALGLAPIVVLLPFWHWRVRRLRRALFASGFRLCTQCGYDVSTLAEVGTCPECGTPYIAKDDVELWAQQGAPYTEPRPAGFTPWTPAKDDAPPAPEHAPAAIAGAAEGEGNHSGAEAQRREK